ncbi:hypothetical protein KY284_000725 [Solanum tuberosum]|nr:hypothetical protein KY284_000725 [Solanum tuberosum]
MNRYQPRFVPVERVQEHVVRDGLSTWPTVVPTTTSQTQEQVQSDVAATQTPYLDPQLGFSVVATKKPKDLKNFMDFKPPDFDVTLLCIEPKKFIDRCEKILTTLGLNETRGVEFTNIIFSGSLEA